MADSFLTAGRSPDAEKRLSALLRLAGDSALLLRRRGDEDWEAVGVSEEYAKMMECSPDQAAALASGNGFLRSVSPEDRPRVRELLARRGGGQDGTAVRLVTASGRRIWQLIRCVPIGDFGEDDVCCAFADVTALKEREEQLRAALDAANRANAAKTAFLSSMSHEIRTPMNAIIGLDSLALSDPDLPARTREYLEKIGSSARHLLGLINDILDMSRIESGRVTLKHEAFSFGGMLEQINTMIAAQCRDRGLTYQCRIAGRVDETYIGDVMKLKQVLINILGNAVKFTPAPGTVRFLVERRAEAGETAVLRFTIQDTGIGMDRAYLPRIFDAFSRESESGGGEYGSSGLGMAITRNIVELMQGTIAVESEKGVGTEFTVDVPLRAGGADVRRGDGFPARDGRALVIDADPLAREHARDVLEEAGVAAETCADAEEALALLRLRRARREAVHLILADRELPDILDAVRAIRQAAGGAVLLLTAYSWDDIAAEAAEAGADGFTAKPLFAAGVFSAFERAASGRPARDSGAAGGPDELAGRRILLAEDTAINAEIMIELLGMLDMRVDHAENGQAAVELFSQSPDYTYDAVLMDMRMPVMDGLAAARAIRALGRPDGETVPIIALTANAFDEDVQRTLAAGMNAHLSKPVEPERLMETLRSLIRRPEEGRGAP